jgi:hypothetical protein
MLFEIEAGFPESDALAFEKLSLQGSVRLTDQELAASADDAMPRNAFAGRTCGHGPTCCAATARKAQRFRERSIGNNPAAGNLFHQLINGIPGRHWSRFSELRIKHRGGATATQALHRAKGKQKKRRDRVP